MALVKCVNGHFYDDRKTDQCPVCGKKAMPDAGAESEERRDRKIIPPVSENGDGIFTATEGLSYEPADEMDFTRMYSDNTAGMDKTVGILEGDEGGFLVCGWLVQLTGKSRGASYPLHFGRNDAGRSLHMDISISDEETVSRETHFSVVYDDRECRFYAVEGNASATVNGEYLTKYIELKEGDVIAAGDALFIFVPYCKEGRRWNDRKKR